MMLFDRCRGVGEWEFGYAEREKRKLQLETILRSLILIFTVHDWLAGHRPDNRQGSGNTALPEVSTA